MAFTYEQKFNDLNNGDLNGQDSWAGSTAFDVIEDSSCEGSKVVKALVSNTDFLNITRSINNTSAGVCYFSFKFKNTSGSSNAGFELYDSGGVNLIRIFYNGSNIQWLNSGVWENLLVSPSNETWYRIGLEWDNTNQANKYRVNIDGGTWTDWKATYQSRSFSGITTILMGARNTTGVGEVYFDYISNEYEPEPEPEPEPETPTSTCDNNCAMAMGAGF